ncbi:hypothetical protein SprV_0501922700 [Sparganum proliferum]
MYLHGQPEVYRRKPPVFDYPRVAKFDSSAVVTDDIHRMLHIKVAIIGASYKVTTDRGAQSESALFQTLLNFLGCTRTAAFHPAASSMVERLCRQRKTTLRAAEDQGNWSDNPPLVLLGIRAGLKSDLDWSAAELIFGTTLRLPAEVVTPTSCGANETTCNFCPVCGSLYTRIPWFHLKHQRPSLKLKKAWTTALMLLACVTLCASR